MESNLSAIRWLATAVLKAFGVSLAIALLGAFLL